jgi:hypothetical protein
MKRPAMMAGLFAYLGNGLPRGLPMKCGFYFKALQADVTYV